MKNLNADTYATVEISKSIKFQIYKIYQVFYCAVLLMAYLLPNIMAPDIKTQIVCIVSGVSLLLTIYFALLFTSKKIYKYNGLFIIFLATAVLTLFKYLYI